MTQRAPLTYLIAICLALLAFLAAPALHAQTVSVSGQDQTRAAAIARQILARRNYQTFSRDTVLPATFHAPGDVVVNAAEVKLEGTVDGGIVVLNGQLYLRPGSKVAGPITILGGGIYPTGQGTHGEIVEAYQNTTVAIEADAAAAGTTDAQPSIAVTVTPAATGSRFSFGPRPFPTYERVDGLTLSAGAGFRPTGDDSGPGIDAWVSYRTARETFGGGVRGGVPFRNGEYRAVAELSRGTRTNDAWQSGDLMNSLSSFFLGRDYRDYYDSDRASLMVTRPYVTPLIAGESWFGPRLGVQWSRDRSLRERRPYAVIHREGLNRDNPDIDAGTIVSAIAGADLRVQRASSSFAGDVQVEQGLSGDADFEAASEADATFTQALVTGTFQATAFRLHQVAVSFRGLAPVGGAAPRQRYELLGGAATLPTIGIGDMRGDHLVFIDSRYDIPISRVDLPFLGVPSLEFAYATGAAWRTGEHMPHWVQDPGIGLRFPLVWARVVVDPTTDKKKPVLTFGVSLGS
jgi:hypothetical protein